MESKQDKIFTRQSLVNLISQMQELVKDEKTPDYDMKYQLREVFNEYKHTIGDVDYGFITNQDSFNHNDMISAQVRLSLDELAIMKHNLNTKIVEKMDQLQLQFLGQSKQGTVYDIYLQLYISEISTIIDQESTRMTQHLSSLAQFYHRPKIIKHQQPIDDLNIKQLVKAGRVVKVLYNVGRQSGPTAIQLANNGSLFIGAIPHLVNIIDNETKNDQNQQFHTNVNVGGRIFALEIIRDYIICSVNNEFIAIYSQIYPHQLIGKIDIREVIRIIKIDDSHLLCTSNYNKYFVLNIDCFYTIDLAFPFHYINDLIKIEDEVTEFACTSSKGLTFFEVEGNSKIVTRENFLPDYYAYSVCQISKQNYIVNVKSGFNLMLKIVNRATKEITFNYLHQHSNIQFVPIPYKEDGQYRYLVTSASNNQIQFFDTKSLTLIPIDIIIQQRYHKIGQIKKAIIDSDSRTLRLILCINYGRQSNVAEIEFDLNG